LLKKYKIWVKPLDVTNAKGEVVEEIVDGYTFMFYATVPMSYSRFLEFFKKAGNSVYSNKKKDEIKTQQDKKNEKQYLTVTPAEQYLISTGKRFFKGYEDYDDVLRLIFDLESTGLNTEKDRIEQFGIRFNRPVKYKGQYMKFEKIYATEGETEEEKNISELSNIINFLKIIYTFKPDIISAHNGEDFDWCLIIGACKRLGTSIEEISAKFFDGETIRKDEKETILKLGGEIEKFHRTIVPQTIITDSLHAVRRAQALDSNMLFSNLKYVSIYSKIVKENRVYLPGENISTTYGDLIEHYAFNNENGDWYLYDKDCGKKFVYDGIKKRNFIPRFSTLGENYTLVSGKYIAERYLLDDLWECDRVEHRYNIPNFLICKMLPVPFQKCCTMGTAGQWKSLLMAWSYENNLAIPNFSEKKSFTGGLSRLLKVGFVDNVAKFDYNSLYPSIILTWGIKDNKDLMMAMLAFLEHVLTQREKYKKLMKKAKKEKEAKKEEYFNNPSKELEREIIRLAEEESSNDKKQLPLKILGNSFFGSYGAPNVFPWGSIDCAERVTCTGRQALRLMIYWFTKLGYQPIVGDSFTEDTPLFIKYKETGFIDIVPICELIDENQISIDELGREYDYGEKPYYVLCRSGWVEPSYIYRHKTDKDIYEISDGEMHVDVTEDHSLFNSSKAKIKPSEINDDTELEYFNGKIDFPNIRYMDSQGKYIYESAIALAKGEIDRVPQKVLNYSESYKKLFYKIFMENYDETVKFSKTCLAGLQFLKKCTIK
jgi:DNA polymerase elongation subunit (family B)